MTDSRTAGQVRRAASHRPLRVVAFTGQDGTGKSTQIRRLRERLERAGLRVEVVHQYEPVTQLGSRLVPGAKKLANTVMRRRRPGRSGGGGSQRRTGGGAAPILAGAYLLVGWIRAWRNGLLRRGVEVLILDRTYGDEIIRAGHKFGAGTALGLALLRTLPAPDLVFAFSLDAETGWRRKKTRELTLEEYRFKVAAIEEVLAEVRTVWPVESLAVDDLDIEEVAEAVWQRVAGKLGVEA